MPPEILMIQPSQNHQPKASVYASGVDAGGDGDTADNMDDTSGMAWDVYSLGITYCHLFSGTPPFAELRNEQIYVHVCIRQGRPFLPEDVDTSVAKLIRNMWAQEPAERPNMNDVRTWLAARLSSQAARSQRGVLEHHIQM